MEEFLSDKSEDEMLQMFLCDGMIDTKERKDSIKNKKKLSQQKSRFYDVELTSHEGVNP
jgi:hypothetical protein